MEPSVTIRCRKVDQAMVEEAVPKSVADYEAMSKLSCKVTVDTTNYLSPTM